MKEALIKILEAISDAIGMIFIVFVFMFGFMAVICYFFHSLLTTWSLKEARDDILNFLNTLHKML
jgi:uncharacterized membrane protein (DUF373 family)